MSTHTFNPTEDELINYLNKKITKEDDLGAESEINEVNICHHEPAEIPALAKMPSNKAWHIISPVERLNGNSQQTRRRLKTGKWKITGKRRDVKDVNGNIIGFKKYLTFEETKKKTSSSFSSSSSTGKKQNKPDWIIHEFHSTIQHPNKDAFVLCKLMKKVGAVAEASPAATHPSISPYAMQNDNISIYDYGTDFSGGIEDIFRAPRSGAVAEASPAATDPISSPYAMQNDNISIYDYGTDFSGGIEDIFRAPRSGAVAEASPAATDPISSPYAMQNDNISIYDYGTDFSGGIEDIFRAPRSGAVADASPAATDPIISPYAMQNDNISMYDNGVDFSGAFEDESFTYLLDQPYCSHNIFQDVEIAENRDGYY